jgi:cysteinyl-tRNA synthetase
MPSPEFLEAISDDLNTPGAMSKLFALSSEIERAMTAGDLNAVAIAKAELLASGAIMGVLLSSPDQWFEGGADDALKTEVEALLAQRVTARADKNWGEADRIRDRLTELNVVVMDSPTGATWRLKD